MNYQNINYTSFRSFDNKKIVDSLMKVERIFELVKTNEFQKIENELNKTGTGKLPVIVAMQDLHGGFRRALSLVGHIFGLEKNIYQRIHTLNDLKLALDEKDIDINLLTKDLNADALVLSLVGSKDGLRLEKSFVKQPNYNVIAKYKSFNKRDEYVLRILNDEKKTDP